MNNIMLGNYECKTTFYMDFTIADCFGKEAVMDTYRRAVEEWGDDIIYMTELSMVLNWKLWDHYEKEHQAFALMYNNLWEKVNQYIFKHFEGDDLMYFYKTTD